MEDPTPALRARLEKELREAMRRRDPVARSALRAVLHSIDNAGAVELTAEHVPAAGRPNEVPRRIVAWPELAERIRRLAEEREAAAAELLRLGLADEADRSNAEAAIVRRWLEPAPR